jgi:hypothetical protein
MFIIVNVSGIYLPMYLAGAAPDSSNVKALVRDCIISTSNYYTPLSMTGSNIPFIPVSIGTAPNGLVPIGTTSQFATYTYGTLGSAKVYNIINHNSERVDTRLAGYSLTSTYETSNINFTLTRNSSNQAFKAINFRNKLVDNESRWSIPRDMYGGKTRNKRKLFKKTRKNS